MKRPFPARYRDNIDSLVYHEGTGLMQCKTALRDVPHSLGERSRWRTVADTLWRSIQPGCGKEP